MINIDELIKSLTPDELEKNGIELARFNIPYPEAHDCVDFSFRYYDYKSICILLITKVNAIYQGNINEIGNYGSNQRSLENGWWDINENNVAAYKERRKREIHNWSLQLRKRHNNADN